MPRKVELTLLLAGLLVFALMPELPHVPLCFYRAVTGHDCPGCGTTRSVFAILHGRFETAAAFNLLGYFVMLLVLRRIATLAHPDLQNRWFNQPQADKVLMGTMLTVAVVQFAYKTLR